MNMKGQEKYHEPETEISLDSVFRNEYGVRDRSIRWKVSNYGKWRFFLTCLATLSIELVFLKLVFQEPRTNGLLSLFSIILTTGISFLPTLPILTYELTRWIKRMIWRTSIDFSSHLQSLRRDYEHNSSIIKPKSPTASRKNGFFKDVISDPIHLLISCICLVFLGCLVHQLGFEHDPRFRTLQVDFPQMDSTAVLHLKPDNRAHRYLNPDLDNISVDQQGSGSICPNNVCSRFALPYIKVCSTCVNVTASLRRTCATVPVDDGPRCTWSVPNSQAELNEISTHLLSSAVSYKNSTESALGDIISLTAIQWLDNVSEDLIPFATDCSFDLRGVLYDTSLSLTSLAHEHEQDRVKALQTIYKPESSANESVIGGWPLEIEYAELSSLQQFVVDKLTGELVADYLEVKDSDEKVKKLIEIAQGGYESFSAASNSLALILSKDMKDGIYKRIKSGTTPWNFSVEEDYISFLLVKYLPAITFLFILSLICNGVVLALGLGLPFFSKYLWSLTAVFILTNLVNANEIRTYERSEGHR